METLKLTLEFDGFSTTVECESEDELPEALQFLIEWKSRFVKASS